MSLRFQTSASGPGRVDIYNVAGRRIRTLIRGFLRAGDHELQWDGRNAAGRMVPAGIYLARVGSIDGSRTARVVMIAR
jgi:flagellar hook assembly protein FlgD